MNNASLGLDPATLQTLLPTLETEHNIKVLFVCESGSRVWGWASVHSDLDVRFVYLRTHDWYLSIDVEQRPDVLELSDGTLDLHGWDLRKALQLLHKSNPSLLEWIDSPLIYYQQPEILPQLQALAQTYFLPRVCAHHYLRVARRNYKLWFDRPSMPPKKWFYMLRPLLAVQWLLEDRGLVPVPFEVLFQGLELPEELRQDVRTLLAWKQSDASNNDQADSVQSLPHLRDFVHQELHRRLASKITKQPCDLPRDALNTFFQETVASSGFA